MLEEDIHPHCLNCVKLLKCSVVPKANESCNIIKCPSDCGAKYHACKGREHKLLCMNEKVPCINAKYGCPAVMFRKCRSKHLISCPASIIHCSGEWDRWPIHVHHEAEESHVGSQLDPMIQSHLDVALAMRDQRMLRRWCVAATKGHPLANHKFTISTSSSLWVFRKWQNSRELSYPPGLEESVCKELCKSSANNSSNSLSHSISNGCHTGIITDLEILDSGNPEVLNSKANSDQGNSGDLNSQKSEKKDSSPDRTDHEEPAQEINPNNELPHFSLDDVLQLSQFGTIVYQSSGEGSIYVSVDPSESPRTVCNPHQNAHHRVLDLKFRNPSSTPPWCLSLGLDLNLEARSQHPPSNFMYTFLCCQEFRRDEYDSHYKNVHSEIHGGLNGWLQERCPLAQYGCKFVRKRFNPSLKNSSIIYNEALESFGISFSDPEEQNSGNLGLNSSKSSRNQGEIGPNLLDLPFDVLQHIVLFLDSFSLANLSLTTTFLRDVCSTVLNERGLVNLKWERHITKDKKSTWVAKSKKWFFSSHFSPIHTWTIENNDNMANHLKTCPYFNRISQKQAFGYSDPNNVHPPTDKRFCDPSKETYEHNTTKL